MTLEHGTGHDTSHRHGRLRGPLVIAVVVALVVVIATAVIFAVTRSGTQQAMRPADVGGPSAATAQPVADAGLTVAAPRTLLVQLVDDDHVAVANLLVETDGEQATMLWLPSTLLVPSPEPVPLAQTPTDFDTLAAQSGVAALLGVRVDATLVVDRLALVGLVDAIGGMQIELDVPVTVTGATGAPTLVPTGSRFVDGVDAAAIALAPGDDSEHAARVSSVLGRVARTLPTTPDGQRALLLSLGSSARSSVSNDELISTLGLLRSAAGSDAMRTEVLPVVVLRSGGGSVPTTTADGLLARTMTDVMLEVGQSRLPRVVLTGSGPTPVQTATAIARLTAAGVAVIDAGDPPAVDGADTATRTVIYLPNASRVAMERGNLVRTALGLPATSMRLWDGPAPAPVDVVVDLASSFVPATS